MINWLKRLVKFLDNCYEEGERLSNRISEYLKDEPLWYRVISFPVYILLVIFVGGSLLIAYIIPTIIVGLLVKAIRRIRGNYGQSS